MNIAHIWILELVIGVRNWWQTLYRHSEGDPCLGLANTTRGYPFITLKDFLEEK